MNPEVKIKLAFDFISGTSPNPTNPTAQTGDVTAIALIAICALLALVIGGWFFLKRFAFANKVASHSKSKMNYWQSKKAKAIMAIVIALATSLLLAAGITVASQHKTAIADSNTGGYTADTIYAYVNEDTGEITFEDTWLKNVGSTPLRIDESYATVASEAKSVPGLENSTLTLKSGLGGNIFKGHPDGTVYRTNLGTPTLRDLPVGETTSLNLELEGLSGESAKQLIGKHVFDLTFNQDSVIDPEYVPDPQLSELTKTYTGNPQKLLDDTSKYYDVSGTNEATDPGTYTVYATPVKGGVWPDKTSAPKEFEWEITKPVVTTEWASFITPKYDGLAHQPILNITAGVLPADEGHLYFTYIIEGDSTTEGQAINQGTYTIKPDKLIDDRTGKESTLYVFDETTKEFKIEALPITATWNEDAENYWTYNGNNKTKTAIISNKIETDNVEVDTYQAYQKISASWEKVDEAINVGQYKFKIATLKNNDLGNYTIEGSSGLESPEAIIVPKSLANVKATVDTSSRVYNGEEQSPNVTEVIDPSAEDGHEVLKAGVDYNISSASKLTNVAASPVAIVLVGTGNYTGNCTSTMWNLTPKTVSLKWTEEKFTYDGTNHNLTAQVEGAVGEEEIEVVSYNYTNTGTTQQANTKNAGNITATATGGIKYKNEEDPTLNYALPTGSALSTSYTISPKSLKELGADFEYTQNNNLVYDGSTKQAFGSGDNQANIVAKDKRTSVNSDLIYGKDFQAAEESTTSAIVAGTYQVQLNGMGNYYDSVQIEWTIDAKSLNDTSITIEISTQFTNYIYDSKEHTPDIIVKDNGKPVDDSNYTLNCEAQINVDTYDFSITGKNNYKDEKAGTWAIYPAKIKYFEIRGHTASVQYDGTEKTVNGYDVYAFSDSAYTQRMNFVNSDVITTTTTTEVKKTQPGYYEMDLQEAEWGIADKDEKNIEFDIGCLYDVINGKLIIYDNNEKIKVSFSDETTTETTKAKFGDKVNYQVDVKNDSTETVSNISITSDILGEDGNYFVATIDSLDAGATQTFYWNDTVVYGTYFEHLDDTTSSISHTVTAKYQDGETQKGATATCPTYLEKTKVTKPVDPKDENKLIYNGLDISIIEYYSGLKDTVQFTGTTVNRKANETVGYTAHVALKNIWNCWDDGSTNDFDLNWHIYKAPLTITAPSNEIFYGDDATVGSNVAIAEGLQGEDTLAGIGQLTYTYKEYTKFDSGVGNYEIIPSMTTPPENYSLTLNNGSLTVNAKPVEWTWPSAEECQYYYDGQVHNGPTATLIDPFNGLTENLPSISNYKIIDAALQEVSSPTEVGLYTKTIATLSNSNYTVEGSSSASCPFQILKSSFSVAFETSNPTFGLVSDNPGAGYKESVVYDNIKLGSQISWELEFGYNEFSKTYTNYKLTIYNLDGSTVQHTIVEQPTSQNYHFNMWTQYGEKLSMSSGKITVDSDITFTAEFSNKNASVLSTVINGDRSGKFNYNDKIYVDEDTEITSDEYGNLSFSTLNLVLSPKLSTNCFVGTWYKNSKSGTQPLIANEGQFIAGDIDYWIYLATSSVSSPEPPHEDTNELYNIPVFIDPIISTDSSGTVSMPTYAYYRNSDFPEVDNLHYQLDSNDLTRVLFTNGYKYVSSVYAIPNEGSNFTGWYTLSASTQLKNPLEKDKVYNVSTTRERLNIFAGFCNENFVKISFNGSGDGIGHFYLRGFEGASEGLNSAWVPKGSTFKLENPGPINDLSIPNMVISYNNNPLGTIRAEAGAASTFKQWDLSSDEGTISSNTDFEAIFDKEAETTWQTITFSTECFDEAKGSVNKTKINVPQNSVIVQDPEDMYTLNIFSSEDLYPENYIDSVTVSLNTESSSNPDFANWWVSDSAEGPYNLIRKTYKASKDLFFKAYITATAKAVYTKQGNDTVLTFYYDLSNHTEDENLIATYPVTKTSFSENKNPKWFHKVNPNKIVIDNSFVNYKWYGAMSQRNCGAQFNSLSSWFNGMSNVQSITGLKNLKFEDNINVDLTNTFANFNSPEFTLDLKDLNVKQGQISVYDREVYNASIFNNTSVEKIIIPVSFLSNNDRIEALFYNCNTSSIIFSQEQSFNLFNLFGSEKFGSNAKSMAYMFANCKNLKEIDLSAFDVSNTVNFSYMFYNCTALTKLNLSNFKPNSITNINSMLENSINLQELDVSGLNTSGLKGKLNSMFSGLNSLNKLTIGKNWSLNLEIECGGRNTNNWIDKNFNIYSFADIAFPTSVTEETWTFAVQRKVSAGVLPSGVCNVTISDEENSVSEVLINPTVETPASYKINDDGQSVSLTVKEKEESTNTITDKVYTISCQNLPTGINVDSWSVNPQVDEGQPITENTTISAVLDLSYPKAVLSSDGKKLTFYNDNQAHTEGSLVIPVPMNYSVASDKSNPFSAAQETVTNVVFDSSMQNLGVDYTLTSMEYWFANFVNLTTVTGLENLDTTNVIYTSGLFRNCDSLISIDLSTFKLPSVQLMSYMFDDCDNLTNVTFPVWSENAQTLTDISYMFSNTKKLTTIDLSGFDTSSVTTMSNMFSYSAISNITFKQDNNTKFSTENVNNLSGMFDSCENIKQLDLSSFNTSKCYNYNSVFSGCSNLTDLNLNNWTVTNSVTIEGKTNNVTFKNAMLELSSIHSITIGDQWTVPLMSCDFNSYNVLYKEKSIEPITTKSIHAGIDGLGAGTYYSPMEISLTSAPTDSIASPPGHPFIWNSAIPLTVQENIGSYTIGFSDGSKNVVMFDCYPSRSDLILQDFSYFPPLVDGKITKSTQVVANFLGLEAKAVYTEDNKTLTFYYDALDHPGIEFPLAEPDIPRPIVGNINNNSINEENGEIKPQSPFSEVANVTEYVVFDSSFASYSYLTYTSAWFCDFKELKSVSNLKTNVNLQSLERMNYMFYGCTKLSGTIDMSSMSFREYFWNTSHMFDGCTNLEKVNLDNASAPYLENMSYMFNECHSLKEVSLNNSVFCNENYDYANTEYMFYNCNSLASLRLCAFNLSNIYNNYGSVYFEGMLSECENLNSITADGCYFDASFEALGIDPESRWYNPLYNYSYLAFEAPFYERNPIEWRKEAHIKISTLPYGNGEFYIDSSSGPLGAGGQLNANLQSKTVSEYLLSYNPFSKVTYSTNNEFLTLNEIDNYGEESSNKFIAFANDNNQFSNWSINPSPASDVLTDGSQVFANFNGKSFKAVDMGETLKFVYDSTTYTEPTYYVSGADYAPMWQFGGIDEVGKYKNVVFDESVKDFHGLSSTSYWFSAFSNLESVNNLEYLDVSKVLTTKSMFENCCTLTSVNFSNFSTPLCYDFSYMFQRCYSLQQVDFSKAATGNCANQGTQVYFEYMFADCESIETIDLSGFNFNKDQYNYSLEGMFYNDYNLVTVSVSSDWHNYCDYSSDNTFYNCSKIVGQNGTSYNDFYNPHSSEYAHIDYEDNPGYFTLKDPRNAVGIYDGTNNKLTLKYDNDQLPNPNVYQIPLSKCDDSPFLVIKDSVKSIEIDNSFRDVPNLMYTTNWFKEFSSLTEISGLEYIPSTYLINTESMFYGCTRLESINLNGFYTKTVQNMDNMFSDCESLTTVELNRIDFTSATSVKFMFSDCLSLKSVTYGGEYDIINMPNVLSADSMFSNCQSLQAIDLSKIKTAKLIDMQYMFYNCNSLESVNFDHFNTKYVKNMSGLFNSQDILEESNKAPGCAISSVDFSKCDLSSLISVGYMFGNCRKLESVTFGENNTFKPQSFFSHVFYHCEKLKTLDLSMIDFTSVNSWDSTFNGCYDLGTIYVDPNKLKNSNSGDGFGRSTPYQGWNTFADCDKLQGHLGTSIRDITNSPRLPDPIESNDENNLGRSPVIEEVNWGLYLKIDGGGLNRGLFTNKALPLTKAKYDESSKTITMFSDVATPLSDTCMRMVSWADMAFSPLGDNSTSSIFSNICSDVSQVTSVIVDDSFDSAYEFKSLESWFNGFTNMETLTNIDKVRTWDVANFNYMFNGCENLSGKLNLIKFATSNNCEIINMFAGCKKITEIDISNILIEQIAETNIGFPATGAFNNCELLEKIYTSSQFDLSSFPSDIMFENCQKLEGQMGTEWEDQEEETRKTAKFAKPDGGTESPGYFTARTTKATLCGASPDDDNLTLNFYWDEISHEHDADVVAYYPNLPNQGEISKDAWGYNEYRNKIKFVNIGQSYSDYYGQKSIDNMFGCDDSQSSNQGDYNFSMCNLESINGLENLRVDNVVSMKYAFAYVGSSNPSFKGLSRLEGWNTAKVTDMSYMFAGYGKANTNKIDAPATLNWNTKAVTSMAYMFANYGSPALVDAIPQTHNFSLSSTNNLEGMFYESRFLHKIDLTNWGSEGVPSNYVNFTRMFYGCLQLKNILTDFDRSNYYFDFYESNDMFYGCNWLPNYSENLTDITWARPLFAYLDDGGTVTGEGYFTPVNAFYSFQGMPRDCQIFNEDGKVIWDEGVFVNIDKPVKIKIRCVNSRYSIGRIYDGTGKQYSVDENGWVTLKNQGFDTTISCSLIESQTITWDNRGNANLEKVEVNGQQVENGSPVKSGDVVKVYAKNKEKSAILRVRDIIRLSSTSDNNNNPLNAGVKYINYPLYANGYAEFVVGNGPVSIEVTDPVILVEAFATPDESGAILQNDISNLSVWAPNIGWSALLRDDGCIVVNDMPGGDRLERVVGKVIYPSQSKSGWKFDHWEYSINNQEWQTLETGTQITDNKDVKFKAVYKEFEPLAITCLNESTEVGLDNIPENLNLQYAIVSSTDALVSWNDILPEGGSYTFGTLYPGQSLLLQGQNDTFCNVEAVSDNATRFRFGEGPLTASQQPNISISGNIMSLILDESKNYRASIPAGCTFKYLFSQNNMLGSVSENLLPATGLSASCYSHMFESCWNLSNAPKLPATTLAEKCYEYMFSNCRMLSSTVELPAQTLVPECYAYMFDSCYCLQGLNVAFDDWAEEEVGGKGGVIPTEGWLTRAGVRSYHPLIECSQILYNNMLKSDYLSTNRHSSIPDYFYVEFSDDFDNIIDVYPAGDVQVNLELGNNSQQPSEPQNSEGIEPSEEHAIIPEPETEPEPEPQPQPQPTD